MSQGRGSRRQSGDDVRRADACVDASNVFETKEAKWQRGITTTSGEGPGNSCHWLADSCPHSLSAVVRQQRGSMLAHLGFGGSAIRRWTGAAATSLGSLVVFTLLVGVNTRALQVVMIVGSLRLEAVDLVLDDIGCAAIGDKGVPGSSQKATCTLRGATVVSTLRPSMVVECPIGNSSWITIPSDSVLSVRKPSKDFSGDRRSEIRACQW